MASLTDRLLAVLQQSQVQLLADWLKSMRASLGKTAGAISEAELQGQCQEFIQLLGAAIAAGSPADIVGDHWRPMREFLTGISRSRGRQGFSPTETASFVLSFREPIATHLRRAEGAASDQLLDDLAVINKVLDKLGLFTTEIYQQTREELIRRQGDEMLELSTPVIQLWDGILALPIIGTLDSERTQGVMEALLQQIVATRSPIAILDITGVPTVDTLTAQHLLKTVAATRLMGAECIISGIRPQIAQTIVHLGVNLGDVVTKASLADAFKLALKKLGKSISVA